MPSSLLATKLYTPHPTPNRVPRPELMRRLDGGLRQGHRLILVAAPAGYGKTTLVADWLGKTGIPSAWLTLDEADNDPARFLTYVVASLQALDLKVGLPPLDAFHATPRSPGALVYPLINDLAAANQPVLLVLDDYHVITATLIQEAMAFLLDHAPPNLHLVTLTRADPPLPLARLRARGQLTELRAEQLRFTADEAGAYLNDVMGLGLSSQAVAALEARTEGWIAGLLLAGLSIRDRADTPDLIRAFTGSHRYIVDYLVEEVLDRQPEAVREFLLKTSVLDRMCAPLCDALLGWEARGQGYLEYLERSDLFLVPLDDERHWYRFHHLFVDVLRQLLHASSPPSQVAMLRARASDWYRHNGHPADAYHHALLAGDHEGAAQIVEENAWSMILHGEVATLKRWVEGLPVDSVRRRPWLCVYYAWALLFGEPGEAEAQLNAVEQRLQASEGATLPAEMQGHITAIRAWIAYQEANLDSAVTFSHQALERYPQIDPAVGGWLVYMVGLGYLSQNDYPSAARAYANVIELAQLSGNIMLEVAVRAALANMSEKMGRLHEAEATCKETLQRMVHRKSPAVGQVYLVLADINRHWNDLASARLYLDKGIESSRNWGDPSMLASGYLCLARLCQMQNKIPEANRALAEMDQVMREHVVDAPTTQWVGAVRASLSLGQGRLDDARRWAEERQLSVEGEIDLLNELEYVALARILLAENRPDEAMHLLARLQSVMESTGRQGYLIAVLVLKATALILQGETDAALAVLEQALSLAGPEGYVRVFLDGGKPIETLLKTAITKWGDSTPLAYARKLLAAFSEETLPMPAAPSPGAGVLSERELEVLHLVAAGWSNQEIADRLVISVRTVKKHVENIHGKLDVKNRTQAVARARELNLL